MGMPLVSIIVPCYNVESTIARYIESVLNQTYRNIEIIFVDDGSTDRTSEIINNYKSEIEKNKFIFKYIFQENEGLGGAIDKGLKYVNGEFLCWSDPDDFYYPESLQKRIEIMLKNPECGVVSSDADVYEEDNLSKPLYREAQRFEHRFEENQFEYLLCEESHFCAGCHMIRMSAFDSVNPDRTIYKAKRGQNWQLLLPVYNRYKRIYIDEPLYAYVLYSNSMSSGDITKEKELLRWNEHQQIITETLKRIEMDDEKRKKYFNMIEIRYALKRFYTAIDFKDKKMINENYLILLENNKITKEIKISYLRNTRLFWKICYKIKDYLYRGKSV